MYTVKFLDNESFDRLPYNRVQTSVGVADRNSGIAYVRDTASPMDVFTAFHEIEHLKGDDLDEHASPGEDGVFYKDFGQILQSAAPIMPFIPGLGIGGAAIATGVGGKMSKDNAKGQQSAMQAQQQPTMDAFNPSVSAAPSAPATSAVSGPGAGTSGGGVGQGTVDKVRQLLQQRQSGFYAGRDAGAI